ncbi:hypothetical protein GOP47_0016626 [Adiantum capillus-veneris]|uniref:DUF7086 domain-containing protein n=1 Tax=Adiantum capillus-veneris TaxID=13818 RepID=A0A9D4UJ16_ADICA|nr:hypothetical protein GOP47_0016626 [Adiantum capillus-veneris]
MSDSGSDDYLRLTLSPPGSRSQSETSSSQTPSTTTSRTDDNIAAMGAASLPHAGMLSEVYSHQRAAGGSGGPMRRAGSSQRRTATTERPASGSGMPKEERIEPPYPWATDKRAAVETLDMLRVKGIKSIWGEVICKKCDGQQRLELEVEEEFARVSSFFLGNRDSMHDRAPMVWYSPRLLDCPLCRQGDCVRPVVASKKRAINWLFLFLTQTLGLCTLEQLKYFCKHNRKHRTGAKDRVLYLTYAGILKQLHPSGPYDP